MVSSRRRAATIPEYLILGVLVMGVAVALGIAEFHWSVTEEDQLSVETPSIAVPLLGDKPSPSVIPSMRPEYRKPLFDLHQRQVQYFIKSPGFGYVRTHYMMFVAEVPLSSSGDAKEHWRIESTELMGLTVQPEPRVYVREKSDKRFGEYDGQSPHEGLEYLRGRLSSHKDNTDDSASIRTRKPSAFEMAALTKLRDGEDVVYAHADGMLKVLGAVRAETACLKCHDVKEGHLLGAFSYTLTKD